MTNWPSLGKKITIDWWDAQQNRFDSYAPNIVIEEAGRENESAIARRLEALAGVRLLAITGSVD